MNKLGFLMAFEQETPVGPTTYDPESYHLTVLPAFLIPQGNLSAYSGDLTRVTQDLRSLSVLPGDCVQLGEDGQVPARLVGPKDPLQKMHDRLLLHGQSWGLVFLTSYIGEEYTAHISHRTADDPFSLNSLSLVIHHGKFGEDVEVMATYPLQ